MRDTASLGPRVGYFTKTPGDVDPEIAQATADETARQQSVVELIASENIVSRAVMEIHGTPLINKTIEGYPGRRYHGGAEHVDRIETLAIERTKRLFGCAYANVQPHSGTQANQAVFLSLLKPGDAVLAMSLDSGGHLSHGAPANMAGKWFNIIEYIVDAASGCIDYDHVRALALEHRPRLVIAGGSAYARALDFPRFRQIADEVGAYLLVDMAHFAGLVAGGAHPDPIPYADVATATTYKNLRGPRGAVILTNDGYLARRLNSAVFPGMQGSPQLHTIAAKAVCLKEALGPDFPIYANQVLSNARTLASRLQDHGLAIVGGGTDTPIVLVDLRPKGVTGDRVEDALERAGITCNKNAVPFDPENPTVTSGLRLGTSAGTTRGFGDAEFGQIADWIARVVDVLAAGDDATSVEEQVSEDVAELCSRFPIYPDGL